MCWCGAFQESSNNELCPGEHARFPQDPISHSLEGGESAMVGGESRCGRCDVLIKH